MAAGDSIGKRSCECACQGCGSEEDADAETKFVAEIEEGEEEGDRWTKTRLGSPEKEAKRHFSPPRFDRRLTGRNDAPVG